MERSPAPRAPIKRGRSRSMDRMVSQRDISSPVKWGKLIPHGDSGWERILAV